MSNCGCLRFADPSGIWDYGQLVGAKVMIKSVSFNTASYKNIKFDTKTTRTYNSTSSIFKVSMDKTFTIKDIYFKCSLDGKVITLIELEDCPGCVFTWKDLELIDIPYKSDAICGSVICGKALCGQLNFKNEEDDE